MNKPPTMSDVANLAGVSTMTVSRALKPDTYIKSETRERILKAVDELGYVMDTTAAGLSSRKTGFVAMIIPSINNANFAETVRGATEKLDPSGLQLLLAYTNYSINEEEKLVAQMLARRPEAIILTGSRHTARCRRMLEQSAIPVIEVWDRYEKPILRSVGFSNAEASKLIVEHMIEQGCSRITFLGGDSEADSRGYNRRLGYLKSMKEHGLEARTIDLGVPPITMEFGQLAFDALEEKYPDTDGVMCVSDPLAFGLLSAATRAGKKIPQNYKLAGFGDYDIAAMAVPSITTVSVTPRKIGTLAAENVLSLLNGKTEGNTHSSVDIELVIRETSMK